MAGGTKVTISGFHLGGATAVHFGTSAATDLTVVSTKTMTVDAPAHAAGTVDVTVTTPAGTSGPTTADHYTYTAGRVPRVTKLAPSTGPTTGKTVVTISGTHLEGATAVHFGKAAKATKLTVVSAGGSPSTPPSTRPARCRSR